MTHDFRSIDWGSDEAKGDDKLATYFVNPPDYEDIFTGTKRYVIGRKGTGKSAIIQRLKLKADESALDFYADLSLRAFPLNDLKELGDRSQRDKSKFVPIWQFLIYTELARLISQDNGALPLADVADLKTFLSLNNLDSDFGFSNTLTLLKRSNSKIKIAAKWIEGEHSTGNEKEATVEIHYQKIVKALEDRLRKISSDSAYWIFIDELDEGFRAGDQSFRLLLLALIRAIEDSAIILRTSNFLFRPLLVLRSDIFDRLEDNDLNKIDDFVIRLRWTSAADHVENSLKRIIVERIRSSLGNVDDAWESIAYDADPDLPLVVDSLWQYIANRTYERPRDAIKFMKCCRKQIASGQKLIFSQVKSAEDEYSAWLYKELKDEIHSHLPCWKQALDCITRIGTGRFSTSELHHELSQESQVTLWINSTSRSYNDVMEILFDFGVIGNLDTNKRWLFKYKDEDLTWNPKMDIIVHFGLNKKLKLLKSRRI